MKETGATSRPVPPNHSDIRRAQVLQPPDSSSDILRGSYLVPEQSPASSQLSHTGTRDFGIIHQHPRVCQGYFQIFSAELCQFSRVFRLFSLGTLLRQYLSAPDGPGLRRRMFSGHAVGEGLAIPVFRFAVICLRRCRGGSQPRPLFFGMASFHAERNPSETWREGQAPPLRHNRKNILSQRAGVAYPPVHGPPPSSVVARTARSSSRPSAS